MTQPILQRDFSIGDPPNKDDEAFYKEIENLQKNYSGLLQHFQNTNASPMEQTKEMLNFLAMREDIFRRNPKLYNEIYNQEHKFHNSSNSRGNEALKKAAMNVEINQKSINLFNTTIEQRLEQQLQSFERLVKNEKEYMFLMSRRYIKMLRRALAFDRIIDGALLDEHNVMRTGQKDLAGMQYNFNIPPQFIRYLENIIFIGIDPPKDRLDYFYKMGYDDPNQNEEPMEESVAEPKNPSQQGPSNIQNRNTAINNYEQTGVSKSTVFTGAIPKSKQS
ncbi:hypothetical protein AVEN_13940-1 [Araneus ventricosus]|uniref:Uncharacterized protein n=1 Tax=Araneus ventricosus TaxID=182803 RepID=A0A4Y2BHU8_ARAVE|nr:hypothetical protein AVEN_13940-1 [Araneus ventricosus]